MNKGKLFYGFIGFILVLVGFISFIFLRGFSVEQSMEDFNTKKKNDLSFIKNFLESNFKNSYPFPNGDVILLDKNLEQIHLEDKNQPYSNIKDLYVVQGTTCGLDINNKKFKNSSYDPQFSKKANKKCYSYAVTKNHNNFQLGAVMIGGDLTTKYAYLTGNIDKSITKDYESSYLVKNGKRNYLPYMPKANTKLKLTLKKGDKENIDLSIKEGGLELSQDSIDYEKLKNNGLYFPKGSNVEDISINAKGDKFLFKVVYPNGNIQLLSPNENGKANLSIENFDYDGQNTTIDIFNNLGKVAYNMVKLSEDSNYDIYDKNGGALVIRGTKFTLESAKNWVTSYLVDGKIDYDQSNGDSYTLEGNGKNVIGFENQEYKDLYNEAPDKLKSLYSFGVFMDIQINESIKFDNSNKEKQITGQQYNQFKSMNDSDIQLNSVNEIINKSNNKKYNIISLSGYFDFDLPTPRGFYLNKTWDKICKENGFQNSVKLKNAYKFLKTKDYSSEKITFSVNDTIKDMIPKNYIISFSNETNDNLGITYFDTKNGNIIYKSNPNTNNSNQKRDGITLICR